MAPSAKHFPFLLLFFALLSSLHSHARESYFFNKATTTTTTPTPTPTNNAKESTVEEAMPNKSNTQEQDPNFISDTQSGYGLFGQNSGHDPTTATTTTKATSDPPYTTTNLPYNYNPVAYVTDPQGMSRDTRFTGRNYATTAATKTNYNPEAYVTDPQSMSRDKRFMDSGYTTTTATKTTRIPPYTTTNDLPYETESAESYPATTINNNNNNYYDKEAYETDPPQGMTHDTRFIDAGYTNADASNNHYNGGGRNYNTEQQGMSDTRFLENGRYFYDINSEQNYPNGYQNSRRVTHNNRGYYGNYNENNDSVKGGYQNEDGHEFQESEEEYVH